MELVSARFGAGRRELALITALFQCGVDVIPGDCQLAPKNSAEAVGDGAGA
jgi:hypothetical protein